MLAVPQFLYESWEKESQLTVALFVKGTVLENNGGHFLHAYIRMVENARASTK
jgi:hypothetical protein